ncbi:dihydroneopterin aldolase [Burkholderia sp. Ac-20365]|jgi:dihydroneopterin aldolase|uniref:dihydroneopterin aldolase n=1 Tax=Burkholderia sp. Ac-20365 TaxID=2703897 RepID=UPI00197C7A63|nr:dihydroneopterin aldolase [Burkholderia sp. Ac-20365]MBN3767349.1 dihydroneopterin aldolase [Burkholderia sp. Ac-20365]
MDRFNPGSSPIHFTVVLPSSARPLRDTDAPPQRGAALDIVYIEGFVAQTIIGIDKNELHERQPVQMDLAIGVPSLRACATDCIDDTVNYAAVRAELHTLLAAHKVQLLEALAEQIAQLLIDRFGAHWVRVKLCKPAKFDDVAAVGVVIERQCARFA